MKTLALAIVMATAAAAQAEPPTEVIATQPIALATRGMTVSYERQFAPRWSWQAFGAVRLGAEGPDYDSSTVTLGGELRRYLRASTPMRGPWVAAHLSVGRTTLTNAMSDLGGNIAFTERVDVGWRWVLPWSITLAPSIGLGAIQDVSESGRLAPASRPTLSIGIELGWFRR